MIVSWNWLGDYVRLDAGLDEVTDRLTMTGLNLEGVEPRGDDTAIDLEVTSNRPDCLGHVGVARELSVLYDVPLSIPEAHVDETSEKAADATAVTIDCEDLCPQYHARVIRGVKIGPSPDWLVQRLEAIGLSSVNNVVDVTNFVLMECGQPLHAFDFDKLQGGRIVVRRGRKGETLTAIDHEQYELTPDTCVIADAERAVAIGGVMGGFDTEISDDTTNLLLEVADFAPLSIRNTARRLKLHSPSSYRFERGVDQTRLDWASRRCCELILQVAGGELLEGSVVAGSVPSGEREPIALRFPRIPQLLGVDVPATEAVTILEKLGCRVEGTPDDQTGSFVPPSWRRDLVREADLIEEVARIHGYERIPVDAEIPLALSARTRRDRVTEKVYDVLTAAGFHEAITLALVPRELAGLFQPRADVSPIHVDNPETPNLDTLRPSLVPSLLQSLRDNERHGNFGVRLFEIAKSFVAADPNRPEQEVEPLTLSLVSCQPFADLKGVVEAVVREVTRDANATATPAELSHFTPGRGAELRLGDAFLGWIGELDRTVTDKLDLRETVAVAELDFAALEAAAKLVPHFEPLPEQPAAERDLNFVLDETVTWRELETTVRESAGPLLESVSFGGQYRGKQIPADKKSYVVGLVYRAPDRTLTGEEVDAAQQAVVKACEKQLSATLR